MTNHKTWKTDNLSVTSVKLGRIKNYRFSGSLFVIEWLKRGGFDCLKYKKVMNFNMFCHKF